MSSELVRLDNKRKRLFNFNMRTNWKSAPKVRNYRRTLRELMSKSRAAIISFERRLAFNKDPKHLFSYVRRRNTVDTSITALKTRSGLSVTAPREIADLLNSHFASVFQVESETLPDYSPANLVNSELGSVAFLEADIADRLAGLDRSKTAGVDGIHSHVLSACSDALAKPLAIIFSASLRSSSFPSAWRKANVTPIFKKGCRTDPSNYRPISLTSVVCKLMESIVRDAIMFHFSSNDLLAPQQHGFVPRKACNTNLLESVDLVTTFMKERKPVDIVFVDFSKAFDKVPHHRLLLKLRGLGIKEPLIGWLEAFLSGRQQRVVLGENVSKWVNVTSGVPQGSVLGPTLFAAFVNDLPSNLSNTCKLYADDLKIIAKVESEADISSLQADLDTLSVWCWTWLMELNAEKCKVMSIGKFQDVNTVRPYLIKNKDGTTAELTRTFEERDLGIILTPDFKFSAQAARAASKSISVLGMLSHTFLSRDVEIWTQLYRTYIRPHLEFAISAWNPFLKRDIAVLEKVQRRVTRLPTSLKGIGYEDRLERMNLTTLEVRRQRGDLIQLFKIIRGADVITWHHEPVWSEPRALKRSQLRREIVTSCKQRHNFFLNRVANAWNELPNEIAESGSVEAFKSELDKYLSR